jgi:hypothetical protein
MAVTAKFRADFGDFEQAVRGAEAQLADFGKGATSAASSLARVTDAFSGRVLIQQATLAVRAVSDLGGASTLTEKEVVKLSATLDDAAAKAGKMGIQLPQGLQAFRAELDQLQPKGGGSWFGSLATEVGTIAAGMVSAQAVIRGVETAFATLTGFVSSSVAAFTEAEASQVRLVAALRQQGMAVPSVIKAYNDLADGLAQTSTATDEAIRNSERLLVQIGGVMPDQMRKATQASLDLAAGLGVDLETATMLVAKAAAGHTETLGRYGITVSDAALRTQGFDAVLGAVNRQFGGSAAADLDTYGGKVKQLAKTWNEIQEAVGGLIVNEPAFVRFFDATAKAAEAAHTQSKYLGDDITLLARIGGAIAGPTGAAIGQFASEWIGSMNAAEEATRRMQGMPSPFKKMADDSALPKMTADLREAVAAEYKAMDAQAEWEKKFDEVNARMLAFDAGVEEINGSVAEAIKYYLALGRSQEDLATWFHVSIGAVAAQAEALTQAKKAAEEYKKAAETGALVWGAFWDDFEQRTKKANDATVALLNSMIALNKLKGFDAQGRPLVDTNTPGGRDYAGAMNYAEQQQANANEAEAVRNRTGKYKDFTPEQQNQALQTLQNNAEVMWGKYLEDFGKGLADATGSVKRLADEHDAAAKIVPTATDKIHELGLAGEIAAKAFGALPGVIMPTSEALNAALGGLANTIDASLIPQYGASGFLGYVKPGQLPGRAAGGPVASGSPYVVGEKGPEVFVPKTSGVIWPNGGGASGPITIHVSGLLDPRTADELASKIGSALLRRSAGRFGSA